MRLSLPHHSLHSVRSSFRFVFSLPLSGTGSGILQKNYADRSFNSNEHGAETSFQLQSSLRFREDKTTGERTLSQPHRTPREESKLHRLTNLAADLHPSAPHGPATLRSVPPSFRRHRNKAELMRLLIFSSFVQCLARRSDAAGLMIQLQLLTAEERRHATPAGSTTNSTSSSKSSSDPQTGGSLYSAPRRPANLAWRHRAAGHHPLPLHSPWSAGRRGANRKPRVNNRWGKYSKHKLI